MYLPIDAYIVLYLLLFFRLLAITFEIEKEQPRYLSSTLLNLNYYIPWGVPRTWGLLALSKCIFQTISYC